MEKVVVAFESDKSCRRIREILESSGTAACLPCTSAAEVKRLVNKLRVTTVICGYKFADESAEELFADLPESCTMLMLARQDLLDLCGSDDIFKIAAPVARGDLIASVRLLLQMGRRWEKFVRPRRNEEERELIQAAKAALMDRSGMSEDQAHRFLQKLSMDSGAKLVYTAQMVLEGTWDA